jgi:hypothetical protein
VGEFEKVVRELETDIQQTTDAQKNYACTLTSGPLADLAASFADRIRSIMCNANAGERLVSELRRLQQVGIDVSSETLLDATANMTGPPVEKED